MDKKLKLFLIFIYFSQIIYSQSGWVRQDSHSNMDLEDVLFVNADTGWTVGYYGTILKTTDGGEQWNLQTRMTTSNLNRIFFICPSTGWIVGENSTILHTDDFGNTWTFQSIDTTDARLSDLFFINDSVGWIANYSENSTTNSLYKTTDGGTQWFRQSVPWSYQAGANAIFFLNENSGWVSNHGRGIGITHNGGISWSVLENNNDFYHYWINSICFVNETVGWTNNSPYGIYKTTDGGNTWVKLDSQPIRWGIDLCFINETTGWATGGFGDTSAVIKTVDGGNSWSIQFKSPNVDVLRSLYFLDSTSGWVVGSGGAIFKTTTGGITSVDDEKNGHILPNKIEISQNYPNPFNPGTIIKYTIPSNVKSQMLNVKLIVYDVLGREVAILVNEQKQPGVYDVEFNSDNFSAGIYYYRLVNGNYSETKKMVLLK